MAVIDTLDWVTKRCYDALGNTTTYGYTRDLLISITDANNNVPSYSYDTLKRFTRTTFLDAADEDLASAARSRQNPTSNPG